MSSILYPNIGGAPGGVPLTRDPAQAPDSAAGRAGQAGPAPAEQDFRNVLKESIALNGSPAGKAPDSVVGQNFVKAPLKFSSHAQSRIQSRGIDMGADMMRKLGEAVDRAAAKGLDDTLVLTQDAAFIVSVKNRTVVTAMDRSQLEGNVFTNIEGAVIV